MIPSHPVHVPQPCQRRHHALHPLDHPRLIVRTPLPPATRRRQLRHPNLLVRPRRMQSLDLINRALRIHTIHMRGDDPDLIHAARAGFGEVAKVGAGGIGGGGGDEFGAGLGVDER